MDLYDLENQFIKETGDSPKSLYCHVEAHSTEFVEWLAKKYLSSPQTTSNKTQYETIEKAHKDWLKFNEAQKESVRAMFENIASHLC